MAYGVGKAMKIEGKRETVENQNEDEIVATLEDIHQM